PQRARPRRRPRRGVVAPPRSGLGGMVPGRMTDGVLPIALGLIDPPAASPAGPRDGRGVEEDVVHRAARAAHPAPREAAHQLLLRYDDEDGGIEPLSPTRHELVEGARLCEGPRKAVEDVPRAGVRLL